MVRAPSFQTGALLPLVALLLVPVVTRAQEAPPNDDVTDATVIAASGTYAGSTAGATSEFGERGATCLDRGPQSDGGRSVWWRYDPTEDGTLILDLSGSGFDTVLSVRRGTGEHAGAEFACDNDGGDGDRSRVEAFPVAAGERYYVRVSGVEEAEGSVVLDVTVGPPVLPPNDDRADATVILDDGRYFGMNGQATSEPDEPAASCASPSFPDSGQSLWWTYTADAATTITIDLFGAAGSFTLLSVHDEDGAELACDDQLVEDFALAAGQTVYVRASSEEPWTGLMTFAFWSGSNVRPSNDDGADAVPLVVDGSYAGTNVGATTESGETGASCTPGGVAADIGRSVWWRIDLSGEALVTLDLAGSVLDAVLSVHDEAGAELACATGEGQTTGSPLFENLSLSEGEGYLVRVSGYDDTDGSGPTGAIVLNFDASPALTNDDRADAIVIPEPGTYIGTTRTATAEPGEESASCPRALDGMASAWWVYTVPTDGALSVDLAGSEIGFDTILSFHDETGEIGCNDDDPTNGHPLDHTSRLSNVPVEAGQTVYLRVSGYHNGIGEPDQGEVTLTLDLAPPVVTSVLTTGDTSEGPFWELPGVNESGAGCGYTAAVPRHEATPFTVGATGEFSFTTTWEGYDGCAFVYEAPFDPEMACENLIRGGCSWVSGTPAHVPALPLEVDASYVFVASGGFGEESAGAYVVEALGPAPVNFDSAVAAEPSSAPTEITLSAVHPNPMRGHAAFTLTLDRAEHVVVDVLDVLGRRVATLHEGALTAGSHALALDGSALPVATYIVHATGETFSLVQRVTVVR